MGKPEKCGYCTNQKNKENKNGNRKIKMGLHEMWMV